LLSEVSFSDEKDEDTDRSIKFSNPTFDDSNEPPPKYSEVKETETTAF